METLLAFTGKSYIRNGLIWFIYNLARPLPPCWIKNLIYRMGGAHIGRRVFIAPYAVIDPVAPEMIYMEDDVFIGWGAIILSHQVDQNPSSLGVERKYTEREVHLKKGCMIGGLSTVRGGVTVGEGAVVASNSLVLKDIRPHTLVKGVPAIEER